MSEHRDIWELLEDARPTEQSTADLYHWSTNYEPGEGPFTFFLDLIGWSAEHFGRPLCTLDEVHRQLGYVELSKLGAALTEYAENPLDVRAFVDRLMELEGAE